MFEPSMAMTRVGIQPVRGTSTGAILSRAGPCAAMMPLKSLRAALFSRRMRASPVAYSLASGIIGPCYLKRVHLDGDNVGVGQRSHSDEAGVGRLDDRVGEVLKVIVLAKLLNLVSVVEVSDEPVVGV